jgi:hypothetical protein
MSAQPKFTPVTSSPDPMEAVAIYRAQSLLTRNGRVGPILTPDKALRVIRAAERGEKPRVTVPQPRAASADSPSAASDSRSLPGCAAQASTCKDLVPVVRVLRDDETGEVYEVAERHVEYPAPPF